MKADYVHGRKLQQRSASPNCSSISQRKRSVLRGWNRLDGMGNQPVPIAKDRSVFHRPQANGLLLASGLSETLCGLKPSCTVPKPRHRIGLWLCTTSSRPVRGSALQLSKELGHRISDADSVPFKLENMVEVDETYIGGKEKNKHASQKPKKLRGTTGKPTIGMHNGKTGQTDSWHGSRDVVERDYMWKREVPTRTITEPTVGWICLTTTIRWSIIQPSNM